MFVAVADHVPNPPLGMIETKLSLFCTPIRLSPLKAVPLLIFGELCDIPMPLLWPTMFIWRRLSIRPRRSRINLSPASSLIPGSRYMHSAPSSVQSLHFGFVPSHRDFLDRQTSHYIWSKLDMLSGPNFSNKLNSGRDRRVAKIALGYGGHLLQWLLSSVDNRRRRPYFFSSAG